ncbi:NADP-dependent malic enzyme [Agathobaculum desmolans]|uniref:NAD(P)-dependent malic enzyme n=1 Tax=Agathobaculum desmolans TaxID=39484 RepID=UPI0004E22444|nr:malic enzyme-like NAD(P)-binding protein [Agathobaculum desmolans]
MDLKGRALEAHKEWGGKIEVVARCAVNSKEDLSIAYTPGVAEPCLKIKEDPSLSYTYTRRHNLVAVITDGTAVLGLGDIGPEAGMPVMEGKCALFKAFADVDAFPLCVRSKDVDEIVRTIELISGSFGGINLEDIAAPRCFEIERRLKEVCDIPVFHDDQHGTAVCCGAALLNACRLTGRRVEEIRMVVNGCGAAAIAVTKFLMFLGVKDVTMVERFGIVCEGDERLNLAQQEMARVTNRSHMTGTLADAIRGADVFFGMSAPQVLTSEMVSTMADQPMVFAMANPVPEIWPEDAKKGGAAVVGTGRSDYPNQINNVLAFPGIFRGALDVRASDINEEMKLAAARAIAGCVPDEALAPEYIMPMAFDEKVIRAVADAVAQAARETGVARI